MLKLFTVFQNNALFLHSAPLSVMGRSDLSPVKLSLVKDGKALLSTVSDTVDGKFPSDHFGLHIELIYNTKASRKDSLFCFC